MNTQHLPGLTPGTSPACAIRNNVMWCTCKKAAACLRVSVFIVSILDLSRQTNCAARKKQFCFEK